MQQKCLHRLASAEEMTRYFEMEQELARKSLKTDKKQLENVELTTKVMVASWIYQLYYRMFRKQLNTYIEPTEVTRGVSAGKGTCSLYRPPH